MFLSLRFIGSLYIREEFLEGKSISRKKLLEILLKVVGFLRFLSIGR